MSSEKRTVDKETMVDLVKTRGKGKDARDTTQVRKAHGWNRFKPMEAQKEFFLIILMAPVLAGLWATTGTIRGLQQTGIFDTVGNLRYETLYVLAILGPCFALTAIGVSLWSKANQNFVVKAYLILFPLIIITKDQKRILTDCRIGTPRTLHHGRVKGVTK